MERTLYRREGRQGLLGTAIPEEYGGGGVEDFRFNAIIGEEIHLAGVGPAGLGAVKTDPAERHAGMSLLVLEGGMPGFTRGSQPRQDGASCTGHRRAVFRKSASTNSPSSGLRSTSPGPSSTVRSRPSTREGCLQKMPPRPTAAASAYERTAAGSSRRRTPL